MTNNNHATQREFKIEYKGIEIRGYRGSNWVYIGTRPFESMRSAKIWITKRSNE